jgi:hypothetical protein
MPIRQQRRRPAMAIVADATMDDTTETAHDTMIANANRLVELIEREPTPVVIEMIGGYIASLQRDYALLTAGAQ